MYKGPGSRLPGCQPQAGADPRGGSWPGGGGQAQGQLVNLSPGRCSTGGGRERLVESKKFKVS